MASKATFGTRSTRAKTVESTKPTTTRTTRAKAAAPPPTSETGIPKRTTTRKPPATKKAPAELNPLKTKTTAKPASSRKAINAVAVPDREPIMAFLRIRPQLNDGEGISQPYLTLLSDTSVRMTDPHDPQGSGSRFRPSTLAPSSVYTFSHIFLPEAPQSDFFTKTTLPLVHDVLQGQNGLLFTYGVTNSGKTYTIQGGSKQGSAGILPRTLDVLFNSTEGLHGDGKYRPVRLYGIEVADPMDSKAPQITPEPALAEVLGQDLEPSPTDFDIDPTVLELDRNYEYTLWLSYAEVYNEKVYDLLASVKDDNGTVVDGNAVGSGKPMLLTRAALPIKPSPPSDNGDLACAGRYIHGLRQIRIHTAAQAKALVTLGQLHRRVFGTLANRESSRSHGMVIIKVVRGHRAERDDPTSFQISRLTLIDLAGSERTKHTQTTGERLREAGNINKSLMVLGQCMEVMRSNQRKLAMSLSQENPGRVDTRDVKKGLAVVPFRHSKLTEILMDYFVGEGKVVMIVNVNPYDTGFDENSHVMKFAALAREVHVNPAPVPIIRPPSRFAGPGKTQGHSIKELGPLTLKDPEIAPRTFRRKVTISLGGAGKKPRETILEVVEEDEPAKSQEEENGDDDEPINPLINALFDEVDDLHMQLFEAEMRCAIIEAETREEVMREMEERMRTMEEMYSRRLMKELEQNEMKTDAKIDMLHQSGLFGSPVKQRQAHPSPSDLSEEEEEDEMDVEKSLMEDETDEETERQRSMSPLAVKDKTKHTNLPIQARARRETEDDKPDADDLDQDSLDEVTDSSEYEENDGGDDDEDDDWLPETKTSKSRAKPNRKTSVAVHDAPSGTANGRLSTLEHGMDNLSLRREVDDSVVILPAKKSMRSGQSGKTASSDDDDDDVVEKMPVTKKKRQLGKRRIMTEEEIEKTTWDVERKVSKAEKGPSIRRLTGRA